MVQHEMFMTAPATHVIGREPMSRFGNNLGATFRVTARRCTYVGLPIYLPSCLASQHHCYLG